MTRYAGLLRAVNVGGNKLAMADLRRIVEAVGGRDVQTYLQSGNVVFDGPKSVAARVEQALAEELSVTASVLLRSHSELQATVGSNPFGVTDKTVSVTFLDVEPAAEAVSSVDATAYGDDRFEILGREIYLHTPNGYGRSKLTNAFWERKLGLRATTRNWNTVVALAELTG